MITYFIEVLLRSTMTCECCGRGAQSRRERVRRVRLPRARLVPRPRAPAAGAPCTQPGHRAKTHLGSVQQCTSPGEEGGEKRERG